MGASFLPKLEWFFLAPPPLQFWLGNDLVIPKIGQGRRQSPHLPGTWVWDPVCADSLAGRTLQRSGETDSFALQKALGRCDESVSGAVWGLAIPFHENPSLSLGCQDSWKCPHHLLKFPTWKKKSKTQCSPGAARVLSCQPQKEGTWGLSSEIETLNSGMPT